MNRVVGATEARVHFGELMRTVVEQNQVVIVERDGKPQVAVLSVAAYERLRAAAQTQDAATALQRALAVGARIGAQRDRAPMPDIVELIRTMRKERDDQLSDTLGLR